LRYGRCWPHYDIRERQKATHTRRWRFSGPLTDVLCKRPLAEFVERNRIRCKESLLDFYQQREQDCKPTGRFQKSHSA